MNWLIVTTTNMQSYGGVETHIRCTAHELKKMGVNVDVVDCFPKEISSYDVIQTHGGSFLFFDYLFNRLFKKRENQKWVHTYHGFTLSRMMACGEYFWVRGYIIALKEYIVGLLSDTVFVVHAGLKLFQSKQVVCQNGWDSWSDSPDAKCTWYPGWLYIGRGLDRVKGAQRALELSRQGCVLTAIPGEGFEEEKSISKTGRLEPKEIRSHLKSSKGLILTSLYEGLPIVVLEALALGTPVVSTNVGGLKNLSENIAGLKLIEDFNSQNFIKAMKTFDHISDGERKKNAEHNQQTIRTWNQVAQTMVEAVQR